MAFLTKFLPCLGDEELSSKPDSVSNEKAYLTSTDEKVEEYLHALATASDPVGKPLERRLKNIIDIESWTDDLALKILVRLGQTIESATVEFGPALRDAIEKSETIANEVFTFARDHPEAVTVFCTILAIGVLWAVSPWVLGILGFAEEGPVAG